MESASYLFFQVWPYGKDLIQHTKTWRWISKLFLHYPSVTSVSTQPALLYLCLSLRLHCTPQLSPKAVVLKIQGNQSLCFFPELKWKSALPLQRQSEVQQSGADVPGEASMWHYVILNRKMSLFHFFFLDPSHYIEGSV